MSDSHDLGSAATAVDGLTARTNDLTAAAITFAKTINQAFSSSVAGGQSFGAVLTALTSKMTSLSSAGGVAGGLPGMVSGFIGSLNNVKPFAAGGVIGTPSYFPMAGGTGLAGEAGPEAIVPLQRGADGRLGIAAQGGGGTVNIHIATPDAESFRRSESYLTGQIARAVARGQRNL
jgi:phage-related minor tail protein